MSSVFAGGGCAISQQGNQVVVDVLVSQGHMDAGTTVEEKLALVVQGFQTDCVVSVHLCVININDLSVFVVDTKPLRFSWVDNFIISPHKQTEISQTGDVILVRGHHSFIKFIVNVRKEDTVLVVSVKVPPSSEVISRGAKSLNNVVLNHVASEPVQRPAVPVLTQLVS